MKITDQIKTLADAYKYCGLKQDEELPFPEPENSRQQAVNSFMDAMILTEALNEGKKPDYDDRNHEKYEIWWNMRSEAAGGPGFSYFGYDYDNSDSNVSARLVFLDWKVAKYAGTQFPEVYKPFMTFQEFTIVPKG